MDAQNMYTVQRNIRVELTVQTLCIWCLVCTKFTLGVVTFCAFEILISTAVNTDRIEVQLLKRVIALYICHEHIHCSESLVALSPRVSHHMCMCSLLGIHGTSVFFLVWQNT